MDDLRKLLKPQQQNITISMNQPWSCNIHLWFNYSRRLNITITFTFVHIILIATTYPGIKIIISSISFWPEARIRRQQISKELGLKFHFIQPTLNWLLSFWNMSLQPWGYSRGWSDEAAKTTVAFRWMNCTTFTFSTSAFFLDWVDNLCSEDSWIQVDEKRFTYTHVGF